MRIWIPLALGGAAVVVVALAGRRTSDEPAEPGESGEGGDPHVKIDPPIVVGEASDPSVAPFVAQMIARYIGAGIDIERTRVVDHWVMGKAPLTDGPDPDDVKTRPLAVPPLSMWDNQVAIASDVDQVISQSNTLRARPPRQTGYRPRDYNAAVGGAAGSKHLVAGAIDAWVPSDLIAAASRGDKAAKAEIAAYREDLRMAFARHVVRNRKVGWGFGVYTNDIHIDNVRAPGAIVTWEQGKKYIDKAKKELAIA